jgi:tetratricopeptide (TPR) repeat protein
LEATLRFFMLDLMRRPFEVPLKLAPNTTQRVALQPQFAAQILDFQEPQQVPAELSVDLPAFSIKADPAPQLTVYGRGALRWDSVARAAAFITSTDPAVAAFARPPLVAFEAQTQSLGKPGQNLLQAMLLFETLKQHGVRYLADSNTPYTQASADHALVDYVQYPAQTLQSKAGDCDDLTVLYCALLEHAGIATALVDYPEHIFLLFDTGLERHQAYQLPLDVSQYLLRGDRLWIPVEITRIRDTFHQAWQAGLQQLDQLAPLELRSRLVDTAQAWQQFAATAPVFEAPVALVEPALLETSFADQYDALEDRIDAYIDDHYLDPLKQTPANDGLRQQLIQLYCALQQYDTAIRTAVSHLVQGLGDKATTYNQLGVAYFLKGEMDLAALQFQQAVALRPEDKDLQRNLDRALQKLGMTERPAAETASREDTGKAKGVTEDVGVDDFYWLE